MFKHVLLTVDLNEESSWTKALPVAVQCCRSFAAGLHVMTVVPELGSNVVAQYFPEGFEKKMMRETEKQLAEFVGRQVPKDITAHSAVRHGTIYEEVLRTADEVGADLIVIASHRPALRDYLIGPNAARVVRHANVSVLVVRE